MTVIFELFRGVRIQHYIRYLIKNTELIMYKFKKSQS